MDCRRAWFPSLPGASQLVKTRTNPTIWAIPKPDAGSEMRQRFVGKNQTGPKPLKWIFPTG